jgi:PP-loop family
MSLLQLFARQLQLHGVSPGQRIAVAVSGGSDSLALALLTAWWRRHGAWEERHMVHGLLAKKQHSMSQKEHCPCAGGIPEPLASIAPSHVLPAEAVLAARPQEELLHVAQAILQRRGAASGPASFAADSRDAPWAVLQHDIQVAAGEPVDATDEQEPAYAIIVDHALRPESAAEAAATAKTVSAWGMRPLVLTAEWPYSKPRRGGLMKAARLMRQQVYQQACSQHGVSDLLVGHQSGAQGVVGSGVHTAWPVRSPLRFLIFEIYELCTQWRRTSPFALSQVIRRKLS